MEKISIYEILEKVFCAMLPDYTGREKELELYLINLPNIELRKLYNKYK